jgi:hypothetical protein
VSARHYSESEDYHWWCWTWWQRYGRVGGFRGDWLKDNWPATAAYGDTPAEAIESLLRGRFSDQKIDARAVAISLWAGSMPR